MQRFEWRLDCGIVKNDDFGGRKGTGREGRAGNPTHSSQMVTHNSVRWYFLLGMKCECLLWDLRRSGCSTGSECHKLNRNTFGPRTYFLTVQSTHFNYAGGLQQVAFLGKLNLSNKWAGTSTPTELWRRGYKSAFNALDSLSLQLGSYGVSHTEGEGMHHAESCMPFDISPERLRCNSLCYSVAPSPHKSSVISRDVT